MIRSLFVLLTVSFWFPVFAQQTGSTAIPPLFADGNSLVIHGRTESTFENSPFLPEEGWLPGFFVQENGKRFEMAEMRYDTYSERVEYREGGKRFNPKAPVVSFGFLKGDVFMNQFPAFDKHDATTFFQVLYGGKTRLVRHLKSTVSDVTPYNSATKVWHFNRHTTYYLLDEQGMIHKSKKLDNSLLKAFGDKQETVRNYIQANKLTWMEDASVKQIMQFYDSL